MPAPSLPTSIGSTMCSPSSCPVAILRDRFHPAGGQHLSNVTLLALGTPFPLLPECLRSQSVTSSRIGKPDCLAAGDPAGSLKSAFRHQGLIQCHEIIIQRRTPRAKHPEKPLPCLGLAVLTCAACLHTPGVMFTQVFPTCVCQEAAELPLHKRTVCTKRKHPFGGFFRNA
jgi:hypothetical protein